MIALIFSWQCSSFCNEPIWNVLHVCFCICFLYVSVSVSKCSLEFYFLNVFRQLHMINILSTSQLQLPLLLFISSLHFYWDTYLHTKLSRVYTLWLGVAVSCGFLGALLSHSFSGYFVQLYSLFSGTFSLSSDS